MKSLLLSCVASLLLVSNALADPVSFKKDIAPVLLNNCLACHGPKKAEGGYRIDSYERLTKAGDSGAVGFLAKKPEDSEAFRRISTGDAKERMPLDGDPLPPAQVALIKQWLDEGATFDGPDAKAALATIVPPPVHPAAPDAYPNTLPITAVAFSPDGSQVYVGGYNEVTVWNPADGQLIKRIKNTGQRTFALSFSPDGKMLLVASGSPGRLGEVRLFDTGSGELSKVLHSAGDVVFDAAYNPAGDRIASAAADGVLRVYDVASGAEQLAITSHSDWVTAVAWNADGTKLASASRDKTAKLFDAKTGELAVTYAGHNQPLKGVAFHADGAEVFSAGADSKIHQWKMADAAKTAEIAGFGGEVGKLYAVGNNLIAVSADKTAKQFDRKTRNQIRVYQGHNDWTLSASLHEGTKRLATGSFDGEVKIWNTDDGKPIVSFLAAPGYVPKK